MEGTAYKDMSTEQKQVAFEKWNEKRESRQGTSSAKRKAVNTLIANHQTEFNTLLAQAKGPAAASPAGRRQ